MGGWLDHRALKIVKGVYAAPGDTSTAEFPLVVLNLMDDTAGMALDGSRPWSPGIASVEGSGIWSDSPLSVGRYPLVMNDGNVTEKISVILTGSTPTVVFGRLKALHQMALDARAFWTDNAQIQPVFLHWWASCGAGPQYALIYNIDIDQQFVDGVTPTILVTLAIEREPYWRWLPPGANPAQWRYEYYNQPYDYTKASLLSATNALVTGTIQNKSEFNAAFTALVSDNAIVIPASVMVGDAPALLYIQPTPSDSTRQNIIIGKKTVKITQTGSTGTVFVQNAILNAVDGQLGTDTGFANDTGASKAAGAGTAQHAECNFATTPTTKGRLLFSTSATNLLATANRFIGRWMVFLRCRQINGSSGDISMYIRYGMTNLANDTDGVKLNVVSPILTGALGNSTNWGLSYMGVISVPIMPAKADVDSANAGLTKGAGLRRQTAGDMRLYLFASRSVGAGVLYINDLILIPIDEGSITLENADSTTVTGHQYDETGYLTHGTNDPYYINGDLSSPGLDKLTGPGIQLTPGVENRLYLLSYDSSSLSQVGDTTTYNLHIVPRSRGIRDISNING